MTSPKPFKLTAPKKYIAKEYTEQTDIFLWAHGRPARKVGRIWLAAIPATCTLPGIDMLFATLNGVRLPIGLAVKMRDAGLRSGPLDICLDVARGSWFGLRIELKRIGAGSVSNAQDAWLKRLREEHYCAEICDGAAQAIALIEHYLSLPPTLVVGSMESRPPLCVCKERRWNAPDRPSGQHGLSCPYSHL